MSDLSWSDLQALAEQAKEMMKASPAARANDLCQREVAQINGTVRYAFVNSDYTKRAEPADVLAACREIGA